MDSRIVRARYFFLRIALVTCLIAHLAGVAIAQPNSPSLEDLQSAAANASPTTSATKEFPIPRNMQQIAAMRAYFDKTVWAPEVLSQKYERSITAWWDELQQTENKLATLADAPFGKLTFDTTTKQNQIGHGITESTFDAPTKTIDLEVWRSLVEEQALAGLEISRTEWRHAKFVPPTDSEPAQSVIAFAISARRRDRTRFVLRGDLEVTWSTNPNSESKLFTIEEANAVNVRLQQRLGPPTFQRAMKFDFPAVGRSRIAALGPVIVHDLNGDRLPEVIAPSHNRVFHNAGRWRFAKKPLFTFPVNGITAAVVGDFNGDGASDLLCGAINSHLLLFAGKGDGTFPDKPLAIIPDVSTKRPFAISAGDIDADGDLDVFVGQVKVGYETGDLPARYFDANDSFPSMLLLNDGTGNFTDATAAAGLEKQSHRRVRAATLVDLDDDSDLDLLLTSDFGGTELLLNDGKGQLTDMTATKLVPRKHAHGMSHTLGDYNGDGKLDFVSVATSSTASRRLHDLQLGRPDFPVYNQLRTEMGYGNRKYMRTGTGEETTFVLATNNDDVARTGWPFGSTTLDFDRDGDQDIFIANGRISGTKTLDYEPRFWCHDIYIRPEARAASRQFTRKFSQFLGKQFSWNGHQENALLLNDGTGNFTDVGFLVGAGSVLDSRAAVSGDLDLDGRPDIIFQHANATTLTLQFLRNRSNDAHHWIGVHLATPKNVSTHGAAVTVRTSDRVLVQHCLSGHSAAAQHGATLHFGLGDATKVLKIEVRWPNGSVATIDKPKIDAYHEASP